MPTNVSPAYKKAEAEYKKAREAPEKLKWLREMLSSIPKHKGTEHLQADIKTRIKQFTDEQTGPKKGGARTGPVQTIHSEGAAQVALIGPPNAGKSALHAAWTGSHASIGPYPFTTHEPMPGMYEWEDVQFQLIDLPAISADYMENWYINSLQPADCALLVVDLDDPETLDHVIAIREKLDERRVTLLEHWPYSLELADPDASDEDRAKGKHLMSVAHRAATGEGDSDDDELGDPFRLYLPTLLVANKSDLDPDPEEVKVLEELLGVSYPTLTVSAETGAGLQGLGPLLFRGLGVVRVYTKVPGQQETTERPYALRRGETVHDVALQVHREIADRLKFGKIWGKSVQFDGQQVSGDHVCEDGDVLELHA